MRQFAANMQPISKLVVFGHHVGLDSPYNRREDSASKYRVHFQRVEQVLWVAVEFPKGLLP